VLAAFTLAADPLTDPGSWISSGGIVALVLFVLISGARDTPLWIYGGAHRRIVNDCERRCTEATDRADKWERLALRGTMLAESGADELERRVRGG
jgi:hypothetical protein